MSTIKLYHGTSIRFASKILREGFKRSSVPSYTGTGVNLSECMTIAYAYGSYESRGCVLECELSENARIHEFYSGASDKYFFENGEVDAVKTYGGNVWVVWNTGIIKGIRKLSKSESLKLLHAEFEIDGDNCAYNGYVQDHCERYWNSKGERHCYST